MNHLSVKVNKKINFFKNIIFNKNMNIHEYQAKDLIKKFGASVSKGVVIFNLNEIDEKIKQDRKSVV